MSFKRKIIVYISLALLLVFSGGTGYFAVSLVKKKGSKSTRNSPRIKIVQRPREYEEEIGEYEIVFEEGEESDAVVAVAEEEESLAELDGDGEIVFEQDAEIEESDTAVVIGEGEEFFDELEEELALEEEPEESLGEIAVAEEEEFLVELEEEYDLAQEESAQAKELEEVAVVEEAEVEGVVAEEAEKVEEVAVIEEAQKVEEVAVVEEAEKAEEVAFVEEDEEVEEVAAEVVVAEEAKKVEEVAVVEEAEKVEEVAVVEEAEKAEEVAFVEEAEKVEEVAAEVVVAGESEEVAVVEEPENGEEPKAEVVVADEPEKIEGADVAVVAAVEQGDVSRDLISEVTPDEADLSVVVDGAFIREPPMEEPDLLDAAVAVSELERAIDQVPRIKSVVLLGADARFKEHKADGIEFVDLQVPGDFADLEQELASYLNQPIDQAICHQIEEAIASYYTLQESPVPKIAVIEQHPDTGLVVISVVDEADKKNDSVMIGKTKGLVLVDSEQHLLDAQGLKQVNGICVRGLNIPGNKLKLETRLNEIYLGQALDIEKIQEIKKTIYAHYEDRYDPFVLVLVPQQNFSYNVLQVVVLKAKLENVRTEGNRWFSDQRLISYIKTKPGDEIEILSVQKDLNALNRNPFRRVNAIYAPGKTLGSTDIILSTEDRFPLKIYSGAENTGIYATGRQRLFGGFTWGRAFGFDQLLTYQYTTSYNFHTFQGHTAQYMAPFPWNHALNIFGGYSTVYPDLGYPAYRKEGSSAQISGRYTVPLKSRPDCTEEFSFGFDYKNTNTSLFFSDVIQPNASSYVNVSQFVFQYKRNFERPAYRIDFEANLFYSPGELLDHETEAEYSSLREGAKSDYLYTRGMVRCLVRLPKDFTMNIWFRGQLASKNLLPIEQFGMGGYDTVRGYDENQLSMDTGLVANLEWRTPPFSFVSAIRKHGIRDALQFLAFVDYAYGRNHNSYGNEPSPAFLLGVGPGLRYTMEPYISVRADYGFKLHEKAFFTGLDGLIHFNVTASY